MSLFLCLGVSVSLVTENGDFKRSQWSVSLSFRVPTKFSSSRGFKLHHVSKGHYQVSFPWGVSMIGGANCFLCYIFLFPFSPHSLLCFSYYILPMSYGWDCWRIPSVGLKPLVLCRGRVSLVSIPGYCFCYLHPQHQIFFFLNCKLLLQDLGCCLVLNVGEGLLSLPWILQFFFFFLPFPPVLVASEERTWLGWCGSDLGDWRLVNILTTVNCMAEEVTDVLSRKDFSLLWDAICLYPSAG